MLTLQTQSYPCERESGFYAAGIGAEAALLVLSESGTGVWSYVASAPRALLSQAARDLLGFGDAREVPDRHRWLDHVHPADRTRVQKEIERIVAEPCAFTFEARIVGDAGDARWIEVDGLSHHEDGRFVRAGGTVRAAGRRHRCRKPRRSSRPRAFGESKGREFRA